MVVIQNVCIASHVHIYTCIYITHAIYIDIDITHMYTHTHTTHRGGEREERGKGETHYVVLTDLEFTL